MQNPTLESRVQQQLQDLESKMQSAQTARDVWEIIDQVSRAVHNDQDLGKYIRKTIRNKYEKK